MRRTSWAVMAVIVVVGLAVAALDDDGPRTPDERVRDLAATIRCPTCRSQSAADSESPAAKSIRAEIDRRVGAGQSDEEIRDYFASRFGEDILLTPRRSGLVGLVWVLPVVVAIVALGAVALALRRWRSRAVSPPSDADRDLVERALKS